MAKKTNLWVIVGACVCGVILGAGGSYAITSKQLADARRSAEEYRVRSADLERGIEDAAGILDEGVRLAGAIADRGARIVALVQSARTSVARLRESAGGGK